MPPDSDLVALLRARRCAADGTGRRLREAAHLSLRDMAHAAGLNYSTLSRWETGVSRPHGAAAIRYGRLLADLEDIARVAS
jgi:DNA-binding transcriptional regulator YiaG